jgi:hypothetical protein
MILDAKDITCQSEADPIDDLSKLNHEKSPLTLMCSPDTV